MVTPLSNLIESNETLAGWRTERCAPFRSSAARLRVCVSSRARDRRTSRRKSQRENTFGAACPPVFLPTNLAFAAGIVRVFARGWTRIASGLASEDLIRRCSIIRSHFPRSQSGSVIQIRAAVLLLLISRDIQESTTVVVSKGRRRKRQNNPPILIAPCAIVRIITARSMLPGNNEGNQSQAAQLCAGDATPGEGRMCRARP
jgi:hypothetical protein